jgi:hypothetical protein
MALNKHNDNRIKEAEINRARVWEVLYHNPDTPSAWIASTLDISMHQVLRSLRTLGENGYVTSRRIRIGSESKLVYSVSARYVSENYKINTQTPVVLVKNERINKDEENTLTREEELVKGATRVMRLLDNPLKPAPESKKKKTTINIGSGMSLFNTF